MDAGLCQVMKTWDRVVAEVAKFAQVVVYDRAGLGGSDLGPRPRTSQQNVNELRALLVNAGIPGPYVMVGHSFGGFNVRLFASQYPAEVAGMVLIDASYEEQYLRFAAIKSAGERTTYLRHESGENCEKVNLIASAELVHAAPSLPLVPVVVLTADPYQGKDSPADAKWAQLQLEMQSRLARLVSEGKQTMVAGSGHFIQQDQPKVVIDTILAIVNAARNRAVMKSQASAVEPTSVKVSVPARMPARRATIPIAEPNISVQDR